MARYRGPILKKYRALGEDFALKADRNAAEKYKRAQSKLPPGIHGRTRAFRKSTGYGLQLFEKQKARFFYGITEKQLKRYYQKAAGSRGSASLNLLSLLERRLDNVIYRAGFVDSHRMARQLVTHGHFAVNGRRVSIPSFVLREGDKVSFFSAKRKSLAENLSKTLAQNQPPAWIGLDRKSFTAEILHSPVREEIEVPFEEGLVIEFYSR